MLKRKVEHIVKKFITPRQKAKLKKIIGYKFQKDKNYNWPAKGLKLIENYLQIRIVQLLNM